MRFLWLDSSLSAQPACPETGRDEGLLSPQFNAKIVTKFLAQIARTVPADEQAVVLWDGAGSYTSRQLRIPDNVTAVTLPPHSPELNPIENLWQYLKSHCWSNRAYDDYEALEQAVVDARKKVALDAKLMKTVSAATHVNRDYSN